MNKTSRVEWVDVAKFICIMSVIASHLEANTAWLSALYSPYFLSMFFFCSGYVYRHVPGFKSFFVHKLKCLFVPWLIFSIINIILSQVLSFNEHGQFLREIAWNFLQIRGKGDGVWFVAALFVSYIPFYYLVEEVRRVLYVWKRPIFWIVFLLAVMYICSIVYSSCMNPAILPWNSVALPWHIEYVPQALLFMIAGYLFREHYEHAFDMKVGVKELCLLCGIYLILVFGPLMQKGRLSVTATLVYEHLMKLFSLPIMVALCKRIPANRYILFVGRNTLIYFALHGKVLSLGQTVARKVIPGIYDIMLENMVTSSAFAVIFTVVISLVLVIPTYVINRWFPFVIGRKYMKSITPQL